MAELAVRYEVSGAVAFITLNRPDAMNAINQDMRDRLPDAFLNASADEAVRVAVLQGAGEKAFCAGADIKEFAAPDSLVGARARRQTSDWNSVIAGIPKPTIAAIRGFCLGGGLEMSLACDIRIATEDSVFGLPEVRLGIIPGAGGTQRLTRLVGIGHATHLILSGDRIDAAEALRIGLVHEVMPRSELPAAVQRWTEKMSVGAPVAIAYAKEAIRRGIDMPLADGLKLEGELATLLMSTDDRLEGAASFKEKRKPVFRGR